MRLLLLLMMMMMTMMIVQVVPMAASIKRVLRQCPPQCLPIWDLARICPELQLRTPSLARTGWAWPVAPSDRDRVQGLG